MKHIWELMAAVFGAGMVLGLALLLREWLAAPVGYEDEDGFHYGRPDTANG